MGRFSKADIPSPCVTRALCLPRTSSVGTAGGAVPAAGSPEINTSPRVSSDEAAALEQASSMERTPDATTIQGESPEFVEGCAPPVERRTSSRSASASTTRSQAPGGRSSSTVIWTGIGAFGVVGSGISDAFDSDVCGLPGACYRHHTLMLAPEDQDTRVKKRGPAGESG